MRKWENKRKID